MAKSLFKSVQKPVSPVAVRMWMFASINCITNYESGSSLVWKQGTLYAWQMSITYLALLKNIKPRITSRALSNF